jgi:hypothetical protein
MIAVYVRASWLEEIGDMQQSLVRESGPARDVVSLLAGEVHVSYPFIDAKILRRQFLRSRSRPSVFDCPDSRRRSARNDRSHGGRREKLRLHGAGEAVNESCDTGD